MTSEIGKQVNNTSNTADFVQNSLANNLSELNDNLRAFNERIKEKEAFQEKLKEQLARKQDPFPFEGDKQNN